MAYNTDLAERVRKHLSQFPELDITEKKMFGGISFLVNEKMCVAVSDDNLMLRFNPLKQNEAELNPGYIPMIIRGKHLNGYCYVSEEGYANPHDFKDWINFCLSFNSEAKSSKKK
jgi:TfoX/Sxy family transcriptional regulator of competence genes